MFFMHLSYLLYEEPSYEFFAHTIGNLQKVSWPSFTALCQADSCESVIGFINREAFSNISPPACKTGYRVHGFESMGYLVSRVRGTGFRRYREGIRSFSPPSFITRVIVPGYHPGLSSRVIVPGYRPGLSSRVIIPGYHPGLSSRVIVPGYRPGLSS